MNSVNYIDIGIVAFTLLLAFLGWRRGVVLGLVNFIRYSVGTCLCFYFSTNYTQPVYNAYVRPYFLNIINDRIATSGNLDEVLGNLSAYGETVPPFFAQFMKFKDVPLTSTDISESILTTVFEPLLLALTKIIIFIAVFFLFFTATGIIIALIRGYAARKRSKEGRVSPLKKTDMALGLLLGVMKAAIIVFAFSSVTQYLLSLESAAVAANGFFKTASESTLLNLIQGINPFNAITEGLL